MKAWVRQLVVKLTSSTLGSQIVFGDASSKGQDDLDISITGSKYLSSMKDSFTITISNLTYSELMQLILGRYYTIEILAGYKSSGVQSIFNGSVIYMSYNKKDVTTHSVIILAGSKLVAKYGQSRMNLSLNSGINMYDAIKFMCKRAGVVNANIDTSLQNRVLRETISNQTTIQNFLETFTSSNNFVVSTDASCTSNVSIINPYKTNNRIIDISNDTFVLIDGYPTINSDGMSMTILPTYNLMPCDVIVIDNSLLDLSTSEPTASSYNAANYIDSEGKYLITQLDYTLQNRGESFTVKITAKSRSLYSKISGVEGYR